MNHSFIEGSIRRASRRVAFVRTPDDLVGYWLFVLGAVMAAVGIGVFLYSSRLVEHFAAWRLAVVLSSLGLMLLMVGTVHRVGAARRWRFVAYLGAAITLVAIGWFAVAYPSDWAAGADYSVAIIAIYAVGIGLVAVAAIATPSAARTTPDWPEHRATEPVADTSAPVADSEEGSMATEAVSADPDGGATYELFEDTAGEWRWRLRHRNGNIIADSGEGYRSRSGALEAIDRVRGYAETADTLTIEDGAFDLFVDRAGAWRWRLLAPNGLIIADSGEGYSSRAKAMQGLESVQRNAPTAAVEDPSRAASEPTV